MSDKVLEREKEKAYYANQAASPSTLGQCAGSNSADECRQPGLRERIYMQRRRAEGELSRAMALAELENLLDKYPDLARILDLVEQVKA